MSTPERRFCDDAPVSYEVTEADLKPRARTAVSSDTKLDALIKAAEQASAVLGGIRGPIIQNIKDDLDKALSDVRKTPEESSLGSDFGV